MGSCYGQKQQVIVKGFNVQTTEATEHSFETETHCINEHTIRPTKPILEKLKQKNKRKRESSHQIV